MDHPTVEQFADLKREVEALRAVVHEQGELIRRMAGAMGAVQPECGVRRRQRYTTTQQDRLAAEMTVIVRRRGGIPPDKVLADELGIHVKTFGKWKRDATSIVGRHYAAIRRAIGTEVIRHHQADALADE